MLHAPDYTNMNLGSLVKTLNERKGKDVHLKKSMRLLTLDILLLSLILVFEYHVFIVNVVLI